MIICPEHEAFTDERGIIRDLLVEPLDSVTRIFTARGAVRGNHYHRETYQWTYVLRGRLRVVTRMPEGQPTQGLLMEGKMMVSPPMEEHAWEAMEDTAVMVFTRGPRSGADYESDTIRLDVPLIQPR